MADPDASFIPHLLGITLDSNGVAGTYVIAFNRDTGDKQKKRTTSDKVVVFDAGEFENGYSANDVVEFTNVGASVGRATITINSTTGGFQEATITAAAAPTVSVNL